MRRDSFLDPEQVKLGIKMRSASGEIEVRLDPNLSISGEFFTGPFRECRTLVQMEDESFAAFF